MSRIYPSSFIVKPETEASNTSPAIYIGDTRFLKNNGVRTEVFAADDFIMKRVGSSLVLAGGSPRGTFYAVTQYLEKYCGVRWFTMFGEEYVPKRTVGLRIPNINSYIKPSFLDRDLMFPRYTFWGWYKQFESLGKALAVNRINGGAGPMHIWSGVLPDSLGGYIWRNTVAHNIMDIIPPGQYFEKHPEYYALVNGKRTPASLCRSNPEMREVYFRNLTETISKSVPKSNDAIIFHISDPDGPVVPCECAACKALDDKLYGSSKTGQMVDFVNYLAEHGRGVWPSNVKLETLAYSGFEAPPPVGRVDDNVIIRFGPILKFHWDRLDSPFNRRDLKNLQGWLKLASDVRIWDYPQQYGTSAGPVFGLSVTEANDKGLKEWVEHAVKDKSIASAGFQLSLIKPVSQSEWHHFAGRIAGQWERELAIRPTLVIKWRNDSSSKSNTTAIVDSTAAIADSEQTMRYADWPDKTEGGMQLSGAWGQIDGHRSWSYLRFDLRSVPGSAHIIDAELVLARIGLRGNGGEARVAFRAVKPDQNWDPQQLTWNNQPKINDKVLFTMRLSPPAEGYAGYDSLFPQPNLRTLVHNIRIYKKLGAKGVFMETDAPGLHGGLHCDTDLVFWVLTHALWNPDRSADELIHDFCSHYYGPSGTYIEKYTKLLEDAYKQDPYKHEFHVSNYPLQNFLNYSTVYSCQVLFDQAEKACGTDTVTLNRIRRARLSIDIATLFNLDRLLDEYKRLTGSLDSFPFDRKNIETRYRESRISSTVERFPGRSIDEENVEIDKLLEASRKTGVWSLWHIVPPGNTYQFLGQENRIWFPDNIK
jgi:hypothetical protein